MKAHTLAKGKRVIQRLGHAVSEGLFLIPPGHRFNGQQLLQRLQLLSPRAGIAQRYGCIFRSARMQAGIDSFFSHAIRNPAIKLSPAPMVSTTEHGTIWPG